jgi:hypothetical protein
MAYSDSVVRRLNIMLDVTKNSLTAEDESVDAPPDSMKIPLRQHQKTALKGMERLENKLTSGFDVSGQRLYGDFAVLGDSVGVGKSYMILGHIARIMRGLPPIQSRHEIQRDSSPHIFSIKTTIFSNENEAGCIIVVPHTLFRQWGEYIKNTNLKAILLDKVKAFDQAGQEATFLASVLAADVVLISNTLYKKFSIWQHENNITWRRAFFDEADTIHMIQGYRRPLARFTWFVTASWMNIIFANETIVFPQWVLDETVFNAASPFSALASQFPQSSSTHRYMRFAVSSYGYFRNVITSTHFLRGNIVLKCSESYIQESISLPPLYRHQVLCRSPISHQIIGDAVTPAIQNLLHAGDIAGAMEMLGVKSEDPTNLIEAVTKNMQKELERLNQTLAFKSGLEYATEASKEFAIKSLQDKITGVKDKIDTIKSRIEAFKSEVCPICYDDPKEPTLLPCCSQILCGQCVISCLGLGRGCPMCREKVALNTLTKVVDTAPVKTEIVDAPQLEKKSDALIRLIRENKDGRFLIFSSYDNPFASIETSVVDELGLSVKQLKGNKDVISSTLAAFDRGAIRCLLLNAGYAGAGLNITSATHVILLHAMKPEEEKQILGRAYRMGRKGPLHFIKLLHGDEVAPTEQP